MMADPEAGEKIKTMFSNKLNQIQKAKKGLHKLTKSGATGIKKAVKKQIKKATSKKVEMEEFEVEIDEI